MKYNLHPLLLVVHFIIIYTSCLYATSTTTPTTLPKCSVNNFAVSLRFDFNFTQPNNKSYYFVRTTNIHTSHFIEYHQCYYDDGSRGLVLRDSRRGGYLNCTIWRGHDSHNLKQKFFDIDFDLEVIEASRNNNSNNNNKTIWSKKIGDLNNLMYSCFANHQLVDVHIADTKHGQAIQWRANTWEFEYELLDHYRITKNGNEIDNHFYKDCSKLCTKVLHGLKRSAPERICIETYFKGRPSSPLSKCTVTVPEKQIENSSQIFYTIIAVILSIAAFLIVSLGLFVICKKRKIVFFKVSRGGADTGTNSPILPRHVDDVNMDCICPRDKHLYEYPSAVAVSAEGGDVEDVLNYCNYVVKD